MAIAHNAKAGQHAKAFSNRLFWSFCAAWLAAVFVLGCLTGLFSAGLLSNLFTDGRDLAAWTSIIGLLLAVPVGVSTPWLKSKLQARMDAAGRGRIKYLRGGQGEALVSWLLRDLPDDWHLFDDVMLDRASDVDHILIGPGGFFVVSTKSNRGLLRVGPDGAATLNGKPFGAVKDVVQQVMRLREKLQVFTKHDLPYIRAVLATPLAYVEVDGRYETAMVLNQDELFDTFADMSSKLSASEIRRLAESVERLVAAQEAAGADRQKAPKSETAEMLPTRP